MMMTVISNVSTPPSSPHRHHHGGLIIVDRKVSNTVAIQDISLDIPSNDDEKKLADTQSSHAKRAILSSTSSPPSTSTSPIHHNNQNLPLLYLQFKHSPIHQDLENPLTFNSSLGSSISDGSMNENQSSSQPLVFPTLSLRPSLTTNGQSNNTTTSTNKQSTTTNTTTTTSIKTMIDKETINEISPHLIRTTPIFPTDTIILPTLTLLTDHLKSSPSSLMVVESSLTLPPTELSVVFPPSSSEANSKTPLNTKPIGGVRKASCTYLILFTCSIFIPLVGLVFGGYLLIGKKIRSLRSFLILGTLFNSILTAAAIAAIVAVLVFETSWK